MARFVGVSRPGYELGSEHLTGVLDGCPRTHCRWWRSRRWPSPPPTAGGAPRQGRPLWYLVPDGVVQYISKRGLYRKPQEEA